MTKRLRPIATWTAGTALFLAGCMMAPPVTGGSDLDEEIAERARTTARTRSDLLRQLDVPAAIFACDGAEPVPGVPDWGKGIAAHFATHQDSAPAFELFRGAGDEVYWLLSFYTFWITVICGRIKHSDKGYDDGR